MSGLKVQSVLKIDGEEVDEVCEIELLRFYMGKKSGSVYMANPKGDVITRLDCSMSQGEGYVSHIKNMVTGESAYGEEGY